MSRIVEAIAFGLMFVALGLYIDTMACSATTTQDAGTCVVPPGAPGCVLPPLARLVVAHASWDVALTAVSTNCGVSKQVVESIWSTHVQAEVIEGFVPRSVGTGAGITPTPQGGDR